LKTNEFPGIQQAADKASNKAQKYYMRLMKANLIIGVVAAFIAIYNFQQDEPKIFVYIISLFLLVTTLALTGLVKYFKFEDIWYKSRALTESIKTLTWRYVTCSENFESTLSENHVQKSFTDSLHILQNQFPDLLVSLDSDLLNLESITAKMNKIRNEHWNKRLKFYLQERIQDQIDWYTSKTRFNKKHKAIWLYLVLFFQILSIICCLILILNPSTSWNLVGLFTTLSASAIAWLELRQFHSLIQAYTTASMELTLIKSIGDSIPDEEQFTKYVLDSENAISREHTMWLAQRRK